MAKDFLGVGGGIIRIGGGGAKGIMLSPDITSSEDSPIILTNFHLKFKDYVTPVDCLDDLRILYSFGKTFGEVSIMGVAFLGCSKSGASLSAVNSWFESNRVSNKKSPVSVSIAGKVKAKAYITELTYSDVNSVQQSIGFTISGVVAPNPQ